MAKILITGAAGFIGSTFVRQALARGHEVIVVDALTYAGHPENLEGLDVGGSDRYHFVKADITDTDAMARVFRDAGGFDSVVNFAAESHVDNSIAGPMPFIDTNIKGVFVLLEISRAYWSELTDEHKKAFRFLQVSTDEVYGELGAEGFFKEDTPYSPNSPYSASKAAGDHLVRAWQHTYGMPTLVTNCSNNYGPRQFPEKLIPVIIHNALAEKPLPVYGKGDNVRDWIHVEDHCSGLWLALEKGTVGDTYLFGGKSERQNIEVVNLICKYLDELRPRSGGGKYGDLIEFVTDRAGHDWRYAIDDTKAVNELGFERKYKNFEEGLHQTVNWYLENQEWVNAVKGKKS